MLIGYLVFLFCKLIAFLIWFSCLCVGQRDCWTGLPTVQTDKLQRQTVCCGTCRGRRRRQHGGLDSSDSLRMCPSTLGHHVSAPLAVPPPCVHLCWACVPGAGRHCWGWRGPFLHASPKGLSRFPLELLSACAVGQG